MKRNRVISLLLCAVFFLQICTCDDLVCAAKDTKQQTMTIGMVGDVLLHDRVNASGKKSDGTYQYDHLFANVKKQIESYDLAIVNQEVILGGSKLGLSGYPAFNGAQEVGDSLVKSGFDVVLHATNHALDKGKKGALACLDFWKKKHPEISVVGLHESEEEQNQITVCERNGIKVAILNYTYGTNGIPTPKDMPYLVNRLNKKQIKSDVKKAKKLADFVILAPHWGTEYTLKQTKEQENWAKFFLECGVDLVIGTHPHVIEPVKWLKDDNGHRMLTYYSIGNFINATSGTGKGVANRMVGAIAEVTLKRTKDGKVVIDQYGVKPVVSHIGKKSSNITTYFLSDYTKELAKENQIRKQDSTFSLEYCKDLCKKVFGDLY